MTDRLENATSGGMRPKRGFSAWIAGRASRKDYWLWIGPIVAALFVVGWVGVPGLELVFALPVLFVWIRRLHDLGRTGWWAPAINVAMSVITTTLKFTAGPEAAVLASSVLALGTVVALGALPGQSGANAYGPPTGRRAAIAETFS